MGYICKERQPAESADTNECGRDPLAVSPRGQLVEPPIFMQWRGGIAMSVGPMGFYSSIAATPPPPTQTADADRTAQESAGQERQVANETKSESAEGVGQTDGEEHETEDRDADGRRLWEKPLKKKEKAKQAAADSDPAAADPAAAHPSKDATGQSGNQLDLTG
jgi:hypothetical protein